MMDVQDEHLPALVTQERRSLANELLAAAAQHSLIVDELADLEAAAQQQTLTEDELKRQADLQAKAEIAVRRHDEAARQLRRLANRTHHSGPAPPPDARLDRRRTADD